MKKFLLIAGITTFTWACQSNNSADSTTFQNDTSANAAGAPYTPDEGDVSYRNGSVYVWRNNNWEPTNDDVRLNNGAVVHNNGYVERNNDSVRLDDGDVVNKSGHFFDKVGNAIDKGWSKTKEGASKAGHEIKKGANKVGEEVHDVFSKDKKDTD